MKQDEEVEGTPKILISMEALIIVAKASELFLLEVTMRGWHMTEQNTRRTLQKVDLAQAIIKCDIFDFLIDIVPRDQAIPTTRAYTRHVPPAGAGAADAAAAAATGGGGEGEGGGEMVEILLLVVEEGKEEEEGRKEGGLIVLLLVVEEEEEEEGEEGEEGGKGKGKEERGVAMLEMMKSRMRCQRRLLLQQRLLLLPVLMTLRLLRLLLLSSVLL